MFNAYRCEAESNCTVMIGLLAPNSGARTLGDEVEITMELAIRKVCTYTRSFQLQPKSDDIKFLFRVPIERCLFTKYK